MIRRTFGAPLGGTTVGCQYGLEFLTSMLITPPNFAGGGGIYFPSMVVVALAEPGVPVICWAGGRRSRHDGDREYCVQEDGFVGFHVALLVISHDCSGQDLALKSAGLEFLGQLDLGCTKNSRRAK